MNSSAGIMMVSPRDYVLRTTLGASLGFKKGEPTFVPNALIDSALAVNIVPVEGMQRDYDDTRPANISVTGPLRRALIFHGIQEVVKANDHNEFSGGGRPRHDAVSNRIGISVTATEISQYWDEYRDLIGNNAPMPTHPNLELVVAIGSIVSKKEALEYAELLGVDVAALNGVSLKSIKDRLISAAVNFNANASPPVETKPAAPKVAAK